MSSRVSEINFLQVELLWRRAVADQSGGIYCLAYTGLLAYDVSEKAVQTLDKHTHGKTGKVFTLKSLAEPLGPWRLSRA